MSRDYLLRFADVNGSGSASVHQLLAKALFKMGYFVACKNLFPSNIQGLPTWYELRVNDYSWGGRRHHLDFLIALNAQSFSKDIAAATPGAYCLYDSTYQREDLLAVGLKPLPVPISKLLRESKMPVPHRLLLHNIFCLGVLGVLIAVDLDLLETMVASQFQKYPDLQASNRQAFLAGTNYAREHFDHPLPFVFFNPKALAESSIFIDGNRALALGCLYAGATVCAWYPITPSTSLAQYFESYCRRFRGDRYAILQAEDEMAALGMVLGATWMGARAFTATSGPGVSLMSELLGFSYYSETPAVLINVQRCGPSTGLPTRVQQADLLLCAHPAHGDGEAYLLFPASPQECFDYAILAFDLADILQTPVIVMSDIDLGMNDYVSPPLNISPEYTWQRGKILREAENFKRYADPDGDGIPYRTLPGDKGAFFTRGSGHDWQGRYTEDPDLYRENMARLERKLLNGRKLLPKPLWSRSGGETLVISYGVISQVVAESLAVLAVSGVVCDHLRLRAYPFSADLGTEIAAYNHRVIVLEQNRDGQMTQLLQGAFGLKLSPLCFYDGLPVSAGALASRLEEALLC